MTFEKVLNVFADYLSEDVDCEIIQLHGGYTVLIWDKRAQNWDTCKYCGTPEILCKTLLNAYQVFSQLQITGAQRDLTAEEQKEIERRCNQLRERCC